MKKAARLKDPFCGLSHGVGALLSVAALWALLVLAAGRPRHLVAFGIYGATLIALYAASALYHGLSASPRLEARLQRLDHSAIYLLIAGSYTPLCLVTLGGGRGLGLLGLMWGLAIFGIALSLGWHRAPEWVRVALYLLMGWIALLFVGPLRQGLTAAGFHWLVAGGVIYTIGAAIFALDKPHLWPGKFSAHDLWHLFVMAGSACHFIVMAAFVARA